MRRKKSFHIPPDVPFSEMVDTSVDNDGISAFKAMCLAFKRGSADHKIKIYRSNHANASAKDNIEGMTPSEVLILRDNKETCDICGAAFKSLKPEKRQYGSKQIEHSHITHQLRGIVCRKCNLFVGYLESLACDPQLTQKAIAYLQRVDVESPLTKFLA